MGGDGPTLRSMDPTDTLRGALEAAENASPVGAVEAVTRRLGSDLSASAVSFLAVDLGGRALVRQVHVPFGGAEIADPHGTKGRARHEGEEAAVLLPLDGGPAERALREQAPQVLPPGTEHCSATCPDWTVLAPVTERGEALGLLEFCLPREPDAGTVADISRAAHLLAYVLVATRRHTDLYEWGQRSVQFSLSAEIQRRLLPPARTCEGGVFTLSAWLEPAASVGGDTFDYSLERNELHLSLTDAMGHGTTSALTATLCVGSLRNSRRQGASLLEQAQAANAALGAHATEVGEEGFVTGLLARLDLRTGELSVVDAGHVCPLLVREGKVEELALDVALPLGMLEDSAYTATTVPLLPGDRLVLVTDGMLERQAEGLDLRAALLETIDMHARETTRFLADKVLEIAGGELADDATLLVLDWHGGDSSRRDTEAGADRKY